MAKSESSHRSKSDSPFQQVRERPDWVTAVICFLLGTLLLVAAFLEALWRAWKEGASAAAPAGGEPARVE